MIFRHPWGDLADPAGSGRADVTVLGVPYDGGAGFRAGAAEAPARLRAISNSSALVSEEGYVVDKSRFHIRDAGDVPPPRDGGGGQDASETARVAYFEQVQVKAQAEMADTFLLAIGGDHSVHIPLARAFAATHPAGYGTVLLDAHPDLFDVYEGSKTSHACPLRRALETGALRPEHLLILGTRSYNPVEIDFMRTAGIRFVPAREVQRMGGDAVLRLATQQLSGVAAVYLTLDIDVGDPSCARGHWISRGGRPRQPAGPRPHPRPGGSAPVRAMDMVEVAPPLDPTGATEWLALQLIFETIAALARNKD